MRTAREEKASGVLQSLGPQQTLTVGELDSTVIPAHHPSWAAQRHLTVSSSLAAHHFCCVISVDDYSPPLLLVIHCNKFLLIDQSLREERQSKEALEIS